MSNDKSSRRAFLAGTGIGVIGTALGAAAQKVQAHVGLLGDAEPSYRGPTGANPVPAGQAAGAHDAPNSYDVRAFGATGDGKALDTPAINKAIEAAASAGGGRVRFPAGSYLCFSLRLKNNVALCLDPGAAIVAAGLPSNGIGYDLAEPNEWDQYQDFGHSHWHNSLIWGEGLENVSILGPGLIWGRGLSRGYGTGPAAELPGVGNKAIALKNCRNVNLRDFSVLHGGHFAILATGVDNFTIDNLKIDTNRDGIDIDCCRNVRVSNCSVNSPWDDAICLKSSYGLGYAKATEIVTITNCYVTGGYEEGTLLDATYKRLISDSHAFRTGRIKFGTESNGGFKRVTISNCVFEDCRGLALETVDGGLLEDVTVTNLTMRDIASAPIFLRLGSRLRGPAGTHVGELRRISINNVIVSSAASRYASIISGIPGHYIEDIRLNDIYVQQQGGGTRDSAFIRPPEKENEYPEPTMFGTMPAYALYVRHAKGIELSNIQTRSSKEDLRPAIILEDVQNADFFHVDAQHAPGAPAFVLENVTGFSVSQSTPVPDTRVAHVDKKTL